MGNCGLVSIIMPSYNTGSYIAQSIESVLAQTYPYWELIIVDDCSTDDTDEVIAKYLSDSRIIYLKNATNSGAAVSRNRALSEAKGKWIAFLDSDDLWSADKLEKQICFMKNNCCHFSYTEYCEINEDGNSLNKKVSGPRKITKSKMYMYCWPGCLTVMYDAEKIGLVKISPIKKNNDYAMWLQAIHKADCYLLKENLAQYRKRAGSISNHSYWKLVKWHYKLFKEADNKNVIQSAFLTLGNLVCGVFKKIYYVGSVDR